MSLSGKRLGLLATLAGGVIILYAASSADAADSLQKVRMCQGDKAVSPVVLARVIPEYLGYFKQEGLSGEVIPTGSNAAIMAGLDTGRCEFGQGTAADQLPRFAKGENYPGINFFEHIYPFKYAIAVKPDSPLKTYADLKGKKVGVSSFGNSTYQAGRNMLKLVGVDPEKDANWIAAGEGISAGVALDRGDVDALVYDDIGFGVLEAAGVKMRYLPLPDNLPKVGGTFLTLKPEMLKEHRAWAVGAARAVLKGEIFTQVNPEAASWIYLQMYPEATPKGVSGGIEAQVRQVMVPVEKRSPLYAPYDKSVKWGFMKDSEWQDEITYAGLQGQVNDVKKYYTNELIDDINAFDFDKIRAEARDFKLPYKK